MKKAFRLVLIAAALLPGPRPALAQSTYEELQAFSGLMNQIRLNYVDSVSYRPLVRAAIEGVLRSLDPHSYFMSHEDLERETSFMAGTLAGSGIELEDVDGLPVVLATSPGSAAARGGVQSGDRLVAFNDTSVAGLTVQTLRNRMIGEKGTRVLLRLERGPRAAPQSFTIKLKYEPVPAHSVMVSTLLDPQTGYLRLTSFYPETAKEVQDALRKLDGQGMRRLLLDLRWNPGGVVLGATDVAGLFLPKDVLILKLVGHAPMDNQTLNTTKTGPFVRLPLVILVNEHTASAAEALAGSLQDLDRAFIVGRRTFGKALAQRPVMLPPRGDAVFLTVARAVTPSGRIIQRPYRNLTAEQYRLFAGQAPDSVTTFHTAAGRVVQGGGGVAPDVTLPAQADLPVWWSSAANDWLETLVDSVANTLDLQTFAHWKTSPDEWRSRLALPFLSRVRDHLGVEPKVDSALTERIAWVTAYRATEVRWGADRAYEFGLANDGEIHAAATYFGKLEELLKKPASR